MKPLHVLYRKSGRLHVLLDGNSSINQQVPAKIVGYTRYKLWAIFYTENETYKIESHSNPHKQRPQFSSGVKQCERRAADSVQHRPDSVHQFQSSPVAYPESRKICHPLHTLSRKVVSSSPPSLCRPKRF